MSQSLNRNAVSHANASLGVQRRRRQPLATGNDVVDARLSYIRAIRDFAEMLTRRIDTFGRFVDGSARREGSVSERNRISISGAATPRDRRLGLLAPSRIGNPSFAGDFVCLFETRVRYV
jgi:hypothetical protein